MLFWQAAFAAISAFLHCTPEPSNTSTRSLAATLRKRLSLAPDLTPPYVRKLQVRLEPTQCSR